MLNLLARVSGLQTAENVAPDGSSLNVSAASVLIVASFPVATQNAFDAASSSFAAAVASADALTQLFTAAGISVTVETMPVITSSTDSSTLGSLHSSGLTASPEGEDTGVIVGSVIGGVAGALLLGFLIGVPTKQL